MRLVDHLNKLRAQNNTAEYARVELAIMQQYLAFYGTPDDGSQSAYRASMAARRAMTGSSAHGTASPVAAGPGLSFLHFLLLVVMLTAHTATIVFKPSLFFALQLQLNQPCYLAAMPENRSTARIPFVLNEAQVSRLTSDSTYRVFLLSAQSDDIYRQATIQFPQSIEIRVNSKVVPVNVRGLKNKPGTAKPADLTDHIRKDMSTNVVEVVYAFTRLRYAMYVYFGRRRTVSEIVTRITLGRHIPKETVAAESELVSTII